MLRYASMLAVACLTVAAAAFLTAGARPAPRDPADSEENNDFVNRLPARTSAEQVSFHARFSLN
jgi:hypothetical protein